MWKLGSGIRLRHSSHTSGFAEVDCFTFCYFPPTISSRTSLLGKLQQHKGSSSICLHQTKLGTTSWPELCTLRATQLALSVPLIPIGVGLCVVVLNRAFAEKSKRQNCLFLLVCGIDCLLSLLAACAAPKGAQECQDLLVAVLRWSKSHLVTPALRPFEALVWCFKSASQHPSAASVQVPWVQVNTSPHHSAPSEGWLTSELNQKC